MKALFRLRQLTYVLLLQGVWSQAQSPDLIEVDSATRTLKTAIPFDRPFTLKIRSDEEPVYVYYLTDRRLRSLPAILNREFERTERPKCTKYLDPIKRLKESTPVGNRDVVYWQKINAFEERAEDKHCLFTLPKFPEERIGFKEEGGKGHLYMRFDEREYKHGESRRRIKTDVVPPAKNLIVAFHSPMDEGYAVMERVHAKDLPDAIKKNEEIRQQQIDRFGFKYLLPNSDDATLSSIYGSVKANFVTSDAEQAKIDNNSTTKFDLKKDGLLDSLIYHAVRDTLARGTVCLVDCDLVKALIALREMDDAALTAIIKGERTVLDPKMKSKPPELVANLKTSSALLQRLVAHERATEVIRKAAFPNGDLVSLRNAVIENVDSHAAIAKSRKETMKTLSYSYVDVRQITGTSQVYNFKTRSAFRIIPDFGLVVYGMQKGFTRISPYFGVQLNVRQSDKNIPFNLYPNKSFWHRFAFSIGYSVSNVAEEGKREDFFEKGSLMTGIGIRFTNALRITGGNMWFYSNSPNPSLEERRLVFAPYAGLSIDLDLRDLLNGLDKLTTKR